MHALIIDDSKTMRVIVGRILTQVGFQTTEAIHGLDGLKQLENGGRPDLVLVDWNMPEMGGLDFVRAVRANPAYLTLPLVMVTSESDTHYITQALEAGANEYIMKPFTGDMIKTKLELMGFALPENAQSPSPLC